MKVYYVYILQCSDKSYYTGITSNLHKRIEEHIEGKYKEGYTYKRRPIKLVYYCEFTNVEIAIETEKQLKRCQEPKKRH